MFAILKLEKMRLRNTPMASVMAKVKNSKYINKKIIGEASLLLTDIFWLKLYDTS